MIEELKKDRHWLTGYTGTERLIGLIDAEIERQSITDKEVQEAIRGLAKLERILMGGSDLDDDQMRDVCDWLAMAIDALRAYRKPDPCEWCEIASACEYEVTFFKDDDRWATERSLLPKYCPNCGRRLED